MWVPDTTDAYNKLIIKLIKKSVKFIFDNQKKIVLIKNINRIESNYIHFLNYIKEIIRLGLLYILKHHLHII